MEKGLSGPNIYDRSREKRNRERRMEDEMKTNGKKKEEPRKYDQKPFRR